MYVGGLGGVLLLVRPALFPNRDVVGPGGVIGLDGEPVDKRLPGIGPWTTAYVALRSRDDDAFLPTDLGVRHGLSALGADPARAAELAEAWRPYRGFAVAHLWAAS